MSSNHADEGVSNCYVFKSLLQEYAQKAKFTTPVYTTTKEGPSHEPTFRSMVVVNGVNYDSLPGFFNRKAAEQSAAEVALMQLSDSGLGNKTSGQPVYETGLCKNLLQEYAQKMNYAIPLYECEKKGRNRRDLTFSCTVEIGGIKYIGAAAKSRKEAEIKVARTALLAIHSAESESKKIPGGNSIFTVIPSKKKPLDSGIMSHPPSAIKPKRKNFKQRKKLQLWKKRAAGMLGNTNNIKKDEMAGNLGNMKDNLDDQMGQDSDVLTREAARDFMDDRSHLNSGYGGDLIGFNGVLAPCNAGCEVVSVDLQRQGKVVEYFVNSMDQEN